MPRLTFSTKKRAILAASISTTLLLAGPAMQAQNTFIGPGTSWNSGANWSSTATPAPGDALFITGGSLAAGLTETLDGSFNPGTLSFDIGGSSMNLNADATGAALQTLTLGGGTNALGTADLIDLSGATTGTVNIGAAAGAGIVDLALGASGNINLGNAAATLNFGANSVISGQSSLSLSGPGTLVLGGANTFGGASNSFVLNSGTVDLNNAAALGDPSNTFVINGGAIDNTSAAPITLTSYAQTWNGNFTFNGTNALNLGAGAVNLATSSTVTVNGSAALTVGGSISGGAALTKAGPGTLILANTETYSGGTTISAGALQLGDGTANNGAVTGNITDSGTLIFANPQALPYTGTISGSGALIKTGAGNLTLSANNSYQGGTTINAGTLTLNGTNNGAGVITGVLTINAGATLVTASPNSTGYLGGTNQVNTLNINGGTLNDTATGDQLWNLAVNLTGGTLQSNGGVSNAGATSYFTAGGGLTINTLASATTSTVAGRIQLREGNPNNILVITVADGPAAVDLLLSAAVTQLAAGYGITKNGNGTMQISGLGSYTGPLTINGGTVTTSLGNNGTSTALGLDAGGRSITVGPGATLSFGVNNVFFGGGATAATLPNVTLNGGTLTSSRYNAIGNLVLNGGTLSQNASDAGAYQGFQFLGSITVGGTAPSFIEPVGATTKADHLLGGTTTVFNVADATGSSAADLIVSSPLTNGSGDYPGTGSLQKTGAGTMTLSAANNYSGTTTISAGTLALSGAGSLTSSSISVAAGAFFDVSGLTAPYSVITGQSINLVAGATVTGPVTISSGATFNIPAGALLNGTATINSGGILSAGHISGTANEITGGIISTGAINPGGSGIAGTLSLGGDLTLNGGTLNFDLANTTTAGAGVNDLITVGNLTLSNVTNLAINKLNGALASGTYTLLDYSGALTGSLANLSLTGAVGGMSRQTFQLNTTAPSGGSLTLTVAGNSANLIWAGDGSINAWDLVTTKNFLNGGTPDFYYDGDNVTFDDTGSNNPAVAVTGTLQPNSITFNNSAKAYTLGGTGTIAGITGFTKNNNGTVTVTNTNSFSGPVAINNGTVSVSTVALGGTNSALGSGTAISLGDATHTGDLQYTGVTATTNRTLTVNPGGGIVEVTTPGTILTASGVIGGTGAFTKNGSGTLDLTGTNTLSGPVTINQGTLQIGAGAAAGTLGSGAVTVGAAGTLAFFRSDNPFTIANNLGGSGAVVFNGTGTSTQSCYVLTGNDAGLSGPISVTNARLQVSNATSNELGTSAVTASGGGEAFLTGGTFANNFSIAGNGWTETAGQLGAIRLGGGANLTGTVTLTAPSLISTYGATGSISGAIQETGGSQSLVIGLTGGTTNLTLNGASTYTGPTTITNATVLLNGSLGNTAVTVNDGSTLGGHGSIGGSLTLGSVNGATLSTNAGVPGALSVAGALTLNGVTAVTLTFGTSFTTGAPYTLINYGGAITGSAANFTLPNATNYRQAIFSVANNKVTLDIGAKGLTWTGANSGAWDINTTANFTDGTNAQTFFGGDSVTFADNPTTSAVTLTGTLLPSSTTFTNVNTNYVLSGGGNISGTGPIVVNGTGSVTLSQVETLTGTVTVNAGTLIVSGPNSNTGTIGTAGGITVNNSGTIQVTSDNALEGSENAGASPITINTGGTVTISNTATTHISGLLTLAGGTLTSAGGGQSGSGLTYGSYNLDQNVVAGGTAATSVISAVDVAFTHAGGTTFTVAPGATNGIDLDVTGNFFHAAGSPDTGLVKAGNGVMQLDGANTYTGPTTVNAGTLIVNTSGSLTGSAVTVNAGGTLQDSGTIGGASVTVAGGTFNIPGGGSVASGTVAVNSGAALVSGSISGTATTVAGGSLTLVSGGSLASPVTVTGGILAGSGNITGAVTVSPGGTLSPGQSGPGVIGIANSFALNTGGHLAIALDGTPASGLSSMLEVSGSVTLGGDLQLSLGYTPKNGDVFYVLINEGGTPVTGTFSNAVDQGNGTGKITADGYAFLVSYTANSALVGDADQGFTPGQGEDIALEVIPEPGTPGALLAGLGSLLGLQRFRRRRI